MFLPNNQIGFPPVNNFYDVDTTEKILCGTEMVGIDPYWGPGEFIYGKAGDTISQYAPCVCTPVFDSTAKRWVYTFTEVPNTANLGRDLYICQGSMASGEFGWFMMSGLTPVDCQASVAADTTFGIAAAGQGGANSAGKQILGARVIAAATTTSVKAAVGNNGSTQIVANDTNGWFVGVFLSGTGIQAGTTVSAIASDGRTVTLSLATNAAVNGNITATYNNAIIFYNIARINHPIAQGAIT